MPLCKNAQSKERVLNYKEDSATQIGAMRQLRPSWKRVLNSKGGAILQLQVLKKASRAPADIKTTENPILLVRKMHGYHPHRICQP